MLLIRGGRVIDPASHTDAVQDVLINGGTVARIGHSLSPKGCEVIEARGLVVAPGLVDTHVHFREPGQTEKEDIATGAAAAARGGFTTVVCMANTVPPVDNPDTLVANLRRGAATGIRVLQAATITKGMEGRELTDFAALKAAGAACFTDDGKPLLDAALVREAMRRAKELGMVLSFHEEDPALIDAPGVNAGPVARALDHAGASAVAEDVLAARDCLLAADTGARIVLQHISSQRALAIVWLAKSRGADVHAEATPHHFSLTEEAVLAHGALAKMNPPLRTEEDRQAVITGLWDDTVDIIATDHAPHTAAEKALPLAEAPSGIIGLETALALGITHLVRERHIPLSKLIAKMTIGPARCYGLDAGALRVGGPADLVLFDPDEAWTVGDFASKSANSPFAGAELYGRVHRTICGGKTVYQTD